MSLIPHCLPFIVIVFPFFFFSPPSLPLHRRSMPERKWRKAISHRWNGGTFSPRLFIRIDPRYVIPFMEKSRGKSCCLVNPIIHSDFPGVHAVTYRDAVRSWEYLQLVGPSVRWVDVKKKKIDLDLASITVSLAWKIIVFHWLDTGLSVESK